MSFDTDLKLLEAYLDDALSPDDVHCVDGRLAREPGLLAALDEVRAQRAVRAVVWRTMEPTSATLQRFTAATLCSSRQNQSGGPASRLRADFQRK